MKRVVLFAVMLLLGAGAHPVAADPFAYAWQEVASGVWAGIRADPFELPQEGNAVFVVTGQGVVLFDAGGSPLMGEAIVAKVRAVTHEPVVDVILSHWHGDHMRGLQAIRAAWPQARVLAHPHTREWIVQTRERWLKRRETMVPNIRKRLAASLAQGRDLSGRPLIPEERAWLEKGLAITDQLDRENHRTDYVIPDATFDGRLTLHLGGRDIEFLHPGGAHTEGDVILWLPRDSVVATGDIVTAPVPLLPSPDTAGYPNVLAQIRALGFRTLVPGHGAVQHDTAYLDLLDELMQSVNIQMKSLVAQGLPESVAVARVDLSALEPRFTHGDPFLEHRFEDYVANTALPHGAYRVASGQRPSEDF